jgi:hypothetical protein
MRGIERRREGRAEPEPERRRRRGEGTTEETAYWPRISAAFFLKKKSRRIYLFIRVSLSAVTKKKWPTRSSAISVHSFLSHRPTSPPLPLPDLHPLTKLPLTLLSRSALHRAGTFRSPSLRKQTSALRLHVIVVFFSFSNLCCHSLLHMVFFSGLWISW